MVYHIPAMLEESIEGLNVRPDGIYVDVTFGGGGHSMEILKRLKTGKLIAFDQDEDARLNPGYYPVHSVTYCLYLPWGFSWNLFVSSSASSRVKARKPLDFKDPAAALKTGSRAPK